MSQSDSNGSMTPGSASFDAFQYAQIPPILLPFIKKSVFKSEGRLCQFLAPSIARYACKQGQGPANAGHAVCKTAQSLRPITMDPVDPPVPPLGALPQQVSELRSHADVALIARLTS